LTEGEVLRHAPTLMVASQQHHLGWKIDFDAHKQQYDLDPKNTSINIVSEKQIVDVFWGTSFVQHVAQVIVLPMNVPYYHYWFIYSNQVWFLFHHILR